MLKMAYKCLDSTNLGIYESGLDMLENAIRMFGEELKPYNKTISDLLKTKGKKQYAKQINNLLKLLSAKK